jgi:outer membrane protein
MKKKIKNIVVCFMISFLSLTLHSQLSVDSTWNLDKCINYATSNNLDLKTSYLNLIQSEVNKNQSKFSYLPTLSAGGSHGYNWGQKIDPFTNQFATDQVRSNSIYVSSNLTLFSGLRNYYTTQKTNSEFLIQNYSQKIKQRDLRIDVSGLFLQTLMNYKTIETVQEQIVYSLEQTKRIKLLMEQKHKTNYDLLEVESQLGLDSLALIKAQNEYKLSILKLKQFLNVKTETNFEIDTSFQINESPNTLVEINYSQLDENLLVNEQINTQTQSIKIAQSSRYPSLTLSASLGSGYSGNNKELVGTEFLPKPFNTQAKENFYQTVTLSLNIPIFNGNQVNSQIQLANIGLDKAQIEKEKTLLVIENKIEQLKIEIDNASSQIYATEKVLNSLQQNFKVATLKYEEGTINYSQFLEVKNKLIKTEMELLQTRFEYAFKVKILTIYHN